MLLFCPEKIESILQQPAETAPTSPAAVRRLDHLRVRDEVSRRLEERRPLCGCPLEKLDRLLPTFGTFAHDSGLLSNSQTSVILAFDSMMSRILSSMIMPTSISRFFGSRYSTLSLATCFPICSASSVR